MSATSKAQFRFMQAVAHGSIKKPGLTLSKARECVHGESPKGLPERKNWVHRLKARVQKHIRG